MSIATEKKTVVVEVISDSICPWCLVGKRRLEKALEGLQDRVTAHVHWKAFELNEATPPEGVDRATYLAAKYGTVRINQMHDHLTQMAAAEGIEFRFDHIKRIPNTFDSHRLAWLAGREGRQDAVVEALFQAYFHDGRDLGNHEVLQEIGVAAGLDPAVVRPLWTTDLGRAEVRREEQQAHRLGVSGVPSFVVNGQLLASGAQPSAVLAEAILKTASIAPGAFCTPDGPC